MAVLLAVRDAVQDLGEGGGGVWGLRGPQVGRAWGRLRGKSA